MLTVASPFDHVFAKTRPDLRYASSPTELIRTAATDSEAPLRLSDHDGYLARITITRLPDAALRGH